MSDYFASKEQERVYMNLRNYYDYSHREGVNLVFKQSGSGSTVESPAQVAEVVLTENGEVKFRGF